MGSPSGLLPAAPGTSRGQALKRSTAGQGIEAQEAALSPDSGLLEPAAVDAALTYNNKHAKRGAAWIGALQGFLGVGASASYDEPTVQGVAGFQSDKGLSVDGKIGTRTSSKLEKAGVEVQSSETPTEASGGAGGPGAAEDKSASPAPVAPVTTAATPTKEVAPGPGAGGRE